MKPLEKKHSVDLLDEKIFKAALDEMQTPLDLNGAIIKEPLEHKQLYRSFQRVLEDQGIDYEPVETWDLRNEPLSTQIRQLCVRAKVRFQKVALEPYWWQNDGGAMVGFLRGKEQPVALLRKGDSYHLHDSVTGKIERITDKNADSILSTAYLFFPTMRDRSFKMLSLFKMMTKGYFGNIGRIFFFSGMTILLGLFSPLANKVFFDSVIPNLDLPLFVQIILGLVLVALAASLFSFLSALLFIRIEGLTNMRLQGALWDHLLTMPSQFFHEYTTGDLIQRMGLMDRMKNLIGQNSLKLILSGVLGIAYLIPMAYFSLQFTLWIIFVFLLIMFGVIAVMPKLNELQLKILRLASWLNTAELQIFSNVGQLRLFQAEKRAFAYWSEKFANSERQSKEFGNIYAAINSIISSMPLLCYFILFSSFSTFYLQQGDSSLSVGAFIGFQTALSTFTLSLIQIIRTIIENMQFYAATKRLKTIWVNAPEALKPGTLKPAIKGNITLKNISFRYKDQANPIIQDFNLEVKEGEFLAISGPSGCGKSTLLRLLSTLELPSSGSILYEGIDSKVIEPSYFKSQVGIILQTSDVFTGNILENITCGREASPEQIREAVKLSAFDEVLRDLPMGVQTVLVSGGKLISTGQRQRLLLARALLTKPKILLLDEASSGIYQETQRKIFDRLKELKATIIVVTHDDLLLSLADRVIYL